MFTIKYEDGTEFKYQPEHVIFTIIHEFDGKGGVTILDTGVCSSLPVREGEEITGTKFETIGFPGQEDTRQEEKLVAVKEISDKEANKFAKNRQGIIAIMFTPLSASPKASFHARSSKKMTYFLMERRAA